MIFKVHFTQTELDKTNESEEENLHVCITLEKDDPSLSSQIEIKCEKKSANAGGRIKSSEFQETPKN